MQLGLGFCFVGYFTRVRVAVYQQGLGFDSADSAISVRVLFGWLIYKGKTKSQSTRVRVMVSVNKNMQLGLGFCFVG